MENLNNKIDLTNEKCELTEMNEFLKTKVDSLTHEDIQFLQKFYLYFKKQGNVQEKIYPIYSGRY